MLEPFHIKALLSAAALILTLVLFIPYIRSILRGDTVPHFFSWLVWAFGTYIVFVAQLLDGAGIGAWPIGFSAVMTSVVAYLAIRRRRQIQLVRLDWVLLILAISALPIWSFTSDPLWAVALLTAADLIGFGPTVRHAYTAPHKEHIGFFALGAVRNVLVLLALQQYSWTTMLFPAAVGIACIMLVGFIVIRRSQVPQAAS